MAHASYGSFFSIMGSSTTLIVLVPPFVLLDSEAS